MCEFKAFVPGLYRFTGNQLENDLKRKLRAGGQTVFSPDK
jgi:hypothetical protein